MSHVMRDLEGKTKGLSINRSDRKNWCDLSPELKMKCITKMEFKTRLNVRRTAREERDLVDSLKFRFRKVAFAFDNLPKSIYAYALAIPKTGKKIVRVAMKDKELVKTKVIPFMTYILKIGEFDKLAVATIGPSILCDEFRSCFEYSENSFNVKYFVAGSLNPKDLFYFLNRFDKSAHMKKIRVNASKMLPDAISYPKADEDFPCDDFLSIPAISNVDLLQIKNMVRPGILWKLTESWIENDAKVGTTLQYCTPKSRSLRLFAAKFKDRVIKSNPLMVTIRTNNHTKVIELKLHGREMMTHEFLSCTVVSTVEPPLPICPQHAAEIEEEWIFKLKPVALSCDDGDSDGLY